MSQLTNYAESALLNHLLGIAEFTMPTTVYVAAFTSDPGETGDLTNEIDSALNYERQPITSTMSTSVDGTPSTNGSPVTFGAAATADWGTITHFAIMDDATAGAGNALMYAALTASKLIEVGDVLTIDTNQLSAALL